MRPFDWRAFAIVFSAIALSQLAAGCGGGEGASAPPQGETDTQELAEEGGEIAEPLPTYDYSGPIGPGDLFQHGVASGDPTMDAVILWTRLSLAATDSGFATHNGALDVFWEMAEDPALTNPVAAGWTQTSAEADFTVNVDATGLEPGTTFYFRFRALGRSSPVGRTRTLPDGPASRLRFAVVSCSNYPSGYFHGYRHIAERADLDFVVHLGDYIYEYAKNPNALRHAAPDHELVTLQDYRTRYAAYRLDPLLAEAHRQHPWIAVWDDHESANNAWRDGAPSHNEATKGPWAARRAAAEQAYFEWLPIRRQPEGQLWRSFRAGDLFELFMLDTRLWGREEQVFSVEDPAMKLESRQLLGADQEEWLIEGLATSPTRWTALGQQVVMAQTNIVGATLAEGGGVALNPDQWDGYPAARARIFDAVSLRGDLDFVVLSGDIHCSFAFNLTPDPSNPLAYDPIGGMGSLGVEIVAPGITSAGLPGGNPLLDMLRNANPHFAWGNVEERGLVVVDVGRDRLQADWFFVGDVTAESTEVTFAKAFATQRGQNHWSEVATPVPVADMAPALAPESDSEEENAR